MPVCPGIRQGLLSMARDIFCVWKTRFCRSSIDAFGLPVIDPVPDVFHAVSQRPAPVGSIPEKQVQQEKEGPEPQDKRQDRQRDQDILPGKCDIFPVGITDRCCLHTADPRLCDHRGQPQRIVAGGIIHDRHLRSGIPRLTHPAAHQAQGIARNRLRQDDLIAADPAAVDFFRLLRAFIPALVISAARPPGGSVEVYAVLVIFRLFGLLRFFGLFRLFRLIHPGIFSGFFRSRVFPDRIGKGKRTGRNRGCIGCSPRHPRRDFAESSEAARIARGHESAGHIHIILVLFCIRSASDSRLRIFTQRIIGHEDHVIPHAGLPVETFLRTPEDSRNVVRHAIDLDRKSHHIGGPEQSPGCRVIQQDPVLHQVVL